MNLRPADIYGFIAILMWACTATITSYTGSTSPLMLVCISFFTAIFIIIFLKLYKRESLTEGFKMPFKHYLFGIISHGGYLVFFYAGLKLAPIAEANLLNYLWPLLLMLMIHYILRESLSKTDFLGTIFCFVGVCILFNRGLGLNYNAQYWLGYLCATIGAFIWAYYSSHTKNYNFTHDNVNVFFLFSAFIALGLSFLLNETTLPSHFEWIPAVLLGITRISFIFWDRAMKEGDQKLLASLSYFIPLFSTILLISIGKEVQQSIDSKVVVAASFIIVGVLFCNYKKIKILFDNESLGNKA